MNETLREILGGPATLLVYLLVLCGVAVLLLGDAGDFDDFKELVEAVAIPVAGLAAGRGIAKIGKPPA